MIQAPFAAPPGVQQQRYALASSRLLSLDVLRGIALLGALFTSMWIFGGFSTNQQNGLWLRAAGSNYRLFAAVSVLLEGKMQSLISLVFGASLIFFLSAYGQSATPAMADRWMRRQMWLVIFGLINALLLLWTNDLLFHLGVMGILLFPLARLSVRSLLIASLLCTLVYTGKNLWSHADDKKAYRKYLAVTALEKGWAKNKAKKDSLTKEQKEEKEAWEGIVKSKKWDPKADSAAVKSMQTGGYGKLWNQLLRNTQVRESQWLYRLGIWDLSAMILLGMALVKTHFFTKRSFTKQYLLIAAVALTGGVLLGWFRVHYNHVALQDYVKFIQRFAVPANLLFPFEKALMALGYSSLVMVLIEIGFLRFLWQALAAAGRLSLTNYLLQSVACTLFFTGFGMGYYGRLAQYELYFFAAELILVQLVFSVLWLRRFRIGPAEWLWRYLVEADWRKNKISRSSLPEMSTTFVP